MKRAKGKNKVYAEKDHKYKTVKKYAKNNKKDEKGREDKKYNKDKSKVSAV